MDPLQLDQIAVEQWTVDEIKPDGHQIAQRPRHGRAQLADVQASCFVGKLQTIDNRARQLYKNISMLFLFPVKDGKLSTGVNATFDASCYG